MLLHWLVSVSVARPLVAVVVVDQEAREQGYALELEDLVVDDALPLEVAEGEQLAVLTPSGERQELDVAAGDAWEVTGRHGDVWMSRIGEEIRTDVLVVRGEAEAVEALARALDAEVRREDGQWLLVREDILYDAPWVDASELALDEVRFARVSPETRPSPVALTPVAATAVAAGTPALAPAPDRRAPVAPAAVAPASEPEPAVPDAPVAADADVPAPASEPEALVAEALVDRPGSRSFDTAPYVGMYLCGDGTGLALDAYGGFASGQARGDWYVSSPGVVRLVVDGEVWSRAAVETDRRYCRAVW